MNTQMNPILGPDSVSKWNRRKLLKMLGGAAFAVPIAAWVTLPQLVSARSTWTTRGSNSDRFPRKHPPTPTPVPSPTPIPSPTATAAPAPSPTPIPSPSATATPAPSPAPIGATTPYDVTAFGAKGDGTTNDSVAIQAAINAAAQSAGTVYFGAGTYVIGSTLAINAPVTLAGQAMSSVVIAAKSGFHIIDIENATDVTIVNITLKGANANGGMGYGIRTNTVRNLEISNCAFISIPDTGISLSDVSQVHVANCQFDTIGRSGIRFQDPGNGKSNSYVWVTGNSFKKTNVTVTSGHASVQAQGGKVNHSFLTVENNYVEPIGVGLGLDSLDNSVVNNNQVVGDPNHGGEGIAFTGANNTITNNSISNCGAAGILEWCVAYRQNANNLIEGNTCWSNYGQGIAIVCADPGTVLDGLVVRGNRCYSQPLAQPQAIGVQSYNQGTTNYSWVNVSIANNDLRGNTERGIDLIPPSAATLSGNLT